MKLGATALAKKLHVSREAVYRAERSGRITREKDGKFDLEKCKKQWMDRTQPKVGGIHERTGCEPSKSKPVNDGQRYLKAKACSEEERARMLRLEREEREGLLLRKDEIKKCLIVMIQATKQRIMGIPKRLAPVLVGVSDARTIENLLFQEIESTLSQLSEKGF